MSLTLDEVLTESAKLTSDERRERIRRCVAAQRHVPEMLPVCSAPASVERALGHDGLLRYCEACWSVIDADGLTWSWAQQSA